jgi:hypothetical protein
MALFDYNRSAPFDLRLVQTKRREGIARELFTSTTPFGYRRAAEIIRPENDVRAAAILYIHWLETDAPDSNRAQFIGEAETMARHHRALDRNDVVGSRLVHQADTGRRLRTLAPPGDRTATSAGLVARTTGR